jgi:uncharacterized membrane protein YeaQ/YmgE (transglycosylase-associated protein family)
MCRSDVKPIHPEGRSPAWSEQQAEYFMQGLGWIAAIIVGGLAGWIASSLMKADTGVFLNIILGIVGAVVGNALLSLVGLNAQAGSWLAQGVAGLFGAVVLIWIYRVVAG